MNCQADQLYQAENEPQIEEKNIILESELQKDSGKLAQCILRRPGTKTALIGTHRLQYLKINVNSTLSSPSKNTQKNTFRRKMTLDSSNSPNRSSRPQTPGNKIIQKPYRSIYSSQKQPQKSVSQSPQIFGKVQSQSQSPNRRSLYWQSYLLDGKANQNGSNSSVNIIRTLKAQCDELSPITASSYLAIMPDTQQILIESKADDKRQIASLTKIMTAYTVIRICNNYGIKIKQHKITIHQQASWMEGTSANLKLDEEFYIEDLLYGLLLPSGNDAGIALAQYFGKFLSFKLTKDEGDQGSAAMQRFQFYKQYYDSQYQKDSIRLFVFEMNKNSYHIGLKNTHFANPTGLCNSKNYSTARDVALLTCHCLKNNLMREIFKRKIYTCQAVNQKLAYTREVQWKNTNKHLYQFRQCIGVKTGITSTAGPCLSSAYKVLNRQVVVVVLNSSSIQDRYEDARNIYRWCRRNMRICY